MKYLIQLTVLVSIALTTATSCGHSGKEIASIVEERDSLRNVSQAQTRRIARLDTLISSINLGLDTIAAGEAGLFINGVSESHDKKASIMANIDRLAAVIERQKKELDKFEHTLSETDDGPQDKSLLGLVATYKRQLAEKDNQIACLRQELSKKDADIVQLNNRIGMQSKAIAELDRRNSAQNEALKRQDAMLNYCYIAIGTKKELEAKGIVKKGKVVAQSALDRNKFNKVDIRKFTELQFASKRPRILTPMPESSYSLTTDGSGSFILHITNPAAFWKMSNYLVIQTK